MIREATDTDAEAIASLLGELGYPTDSRRVPERLARMRAEAGQTTLVAELEGSVVGMATIIVRHVISGDAPFGRLASVAVLDDWRGRGIGSALVARVEEICRAAGCEVMEVTSAMHRERAHDFYRRL